MKIISFRRSRANALITTLLIVAFLTAILGAVSASLLAENRLVLDQQNIVASQYAARAGIEVACAELLRDDNSVDMLSDGWSSNQKAFENVGVGEAVFDVVARDPDTGRDRSGVIDEESKLNINLASPEELKALSPKFTDEVVGVLVKARSAQPFITLDQFAAMPGVPQFFLDDVTPDAPGGLRTLLTVYGNGKVNVYTAPAPVLIAVGVGKDAAARFVALRAKGADALASAEIPASNRLTRTSEYFTISAEGRLVNSNLMYRLRRVVHRDGNHLVTVLEERTH